jgi:hypothetical protein
MGIICLQDGRAGYKPASRKGQADVVAHSPGVTVNDIGKVQSRECSMFEYFRGALPLHQIH